LEKITGKKRKPFLVPEGVTNVAFEKEVTASEMEPIIGDLEQITDSEKEGAEGWFVEFGPGLQWVQIDLEETFEVYAVLLWHYHSQPRVYRDVVVKSADDKDFIMNVKTVFNNDHDNSSGLGVGKDKEYIEVNEGKLIDGKGVKARFLRFYSDGNTSDEMNHYIEIEVFGKPAE
ncbi:MAG: discoidin domain-containing protein, partial [bacterium]|nr:discoidin domain-containing protein [bacterium]